jgi:hypothetical protein
MTSWVLWVVIVASLVVVALVAAAVVIIRDSRRKSGRWGINLTRVHCPSCGAPQPMIRLPTSMREMLWGGSTCKSCACEIDKWGNRRRSEDAG